MSAIPKNELGGQQWKTQAVKVLGDIAHSLRNPFATVQSYLNILEMEEYKFSPEELKEVTNALQETVDKSLKLIDEKIKALKDSTINH